MENKEELTAADVWKMFAETDRKFAETDRKFAEEREQMREQMKETDRKMQENAEFQREVSKQMKETDRKLEKLSENIGGISNSNGEFAEEYFFNSLERKKEFAGIHFDSISRTFGGMGKTPSGKDFEDEFDIVMVNKKSVALIEVKYKAREKYIEDLVARKMEHFRALFPRYKKFNIYLGLGSFSFDKKVVKKAKEYGVGLLRQVGEAIEYSGDWKIRAY